MREKPEIIATTTVARSRLFRVEQLDLKFSNGVEVSYERLRGSKGGAVIIVPMLDDETVLLIREYAAGVDRYELGLPKGRIEAGEEPLSAANRELMEEVGHGANRLRHLTTFTLAPAYFGHHTEVVLAQDLYEKRLPGDEPEEIEVVPWRLSQLNELMAGGECSEARSIAALFLVRDLLASAKLER